MRDATQQGRGVGRLDRWQTAFFEFHQDEAVEVVRWPGRVGDAGMGWLGQWLPRPMGLAKMFVIFVPFAQRRGNADGGPRRSLRDPTGQHRTLLLIEFALGRHL